MLCVSQFVFSDGCLIRNGQNYTQAERHGACLNTLWPNAALSPSEGGLIAAAVLRAAQSEMSGLIFGPSSTPGCKDKGMAAN